MCLLIHYITVASEGSLPWLGNDSVEAPLTVTSRVLDNVAPRREGTFWNRFILKGSLGAGCSRTFVCPKEAAVAAAGLRAPFVPEEAGVDEEDEVDEEEAFVAARCWRIHSR